MSTEEDRIAKLWASPDPDANAAAGQLERAANQRVGSPCRRTCCWTPFGHSAAAKNCTCHTDEGNDAA